MKDAGPFRSTLPILVILVAAVLLLWLIGGGGAAVPPVFEEKLTLEEATARAGQMNRPVLALASADWCGPCQDLKRGPLTDQRVAALIREHTVPAYVDLTNSNDPESMRLGRRLNVQGIPALILMRGDEEISRLVGFRSADELIAWLEHDAS
jgi:thiol:disulfide interchange protein